MKFNLLDYGYITVSGTPSLNLEDIQNILSRNGTVTLSGSENHNLSIYGDIVDRIGIDQIRYYFDSNTSSGTVASGIHFYYKNDDPVQASGVPADPYLSLTTNIGNGYYYATVPGLSAPRHIKLNHTVSGTSISGTVVGFEVLNDDSVVDFGAAGNITSDTTLTSLSYLNYNDYIKEIEVYNSGTIAATAHVFIDPQSSDVDELISISASENGPWVFARNEDYIIVDGNSFDGGQYDGTHTTPEQNTWNPNAKGAYLNLSNNNLTAQAASTGQSVRAIYGYYQGMLNNIPSKWYWEVKIDYDYSYKLQEVGVGKATVGLDGLGEYADGYCYRMDGKKGNSNSYSAYGDTFDVGDVVGIALDMDNGDIYFSKNGVWQNGGVPASGTNPAFSGLDGIMFPMYAPYYSNDKATINFGLPSGLVYTVPEGYSQDVQSIVDGKLRLSYNNLIGTYTTPIFKNDSVKFAYIDMISTAVSGSLIAVDVDDYVSTIEIRSSGQRPKDYNAYRRIFGPNFYYKDYSLDTGLELYNSLEKTGEVFFSPATTFGFHSHTYSCHPNNITGKCYFIFSYDYYYSNYKHDDINISLVNSEGRKLYNKLIFRKYTSVNDTGLIVYYMEAGKNDDLWLYLKTTRSSDSGYNLSSAGYYLLHYNSSGTNLYNESFSTDFIIGCDMVKNDGTLWYSRSSGTNAVLKLSSTGETLVTYDSVENLGRLCSTDDGGCWFIDDDRLYKLDSGGVLENSITNLEIDDELVWVMRDEEDSEFLWIVDGAYVKLINLDGRVYKSIYIESFTIERLYSINEGLVLVGQDSGSGEYYTKYINKAVGGVVNTILNDGVDLRESVRGIRSISYDNHVLGDLIPLDEDLTWNDSLQWDKAVTSNAVLPREEYNQLKLTLRRPDKGIDSPTVDSIYYQDNVALLDIEPGKSKTLYLRISLPDGMTIQGDYASNLRVWWELPAV